MIWLLLGLNFVISWYNAATIGKWWTETMQKGTGWMKILLWAGGTMAVSGFFYVYVVIITMGMYYTGLFEMILVAMETTPEPAQIELIVETIFSFAYLMVIFPVLGSGLAIWVHSLIVAWYQRDFKSVGIAAWNTFAQTRNTVNAVKFVPKASRETRKNVSELTKSLGGAAVLAALILPIIISLGLAIFTTVSIAKAADEEYDWETLDEIALDKKG